MVAKETEGREKASAALSLKDQLSLFLSPANIKPLLICLVLQFVQQWCGVHVIMFKTVNVFKTFETSIDHNLCTIIVGVVAFFTTFRQYFIGSESFKLEIYFLVSLMLIEKAGRRMLLASSGLLVSLAMAGLATYLSLLTSIPPGLRWLPLPLIVTAFVGFSVGLATIPLSLIGEILPSRYSK